MQSNACSSLLSINRREFLRAGALSLFGLSLPQLLAAQTQRPERPRAKACILLFMWGVPAQQDTWDMKPDAPDVYRGDFRPITTSVPGLQICEHLPRLADRAHRLALIRSMTHDNVDHTRATHFLLTGKPPPVGELSDDWPSYGAILSKLGRGTGPLPPFVSMMPVVPNGSPRFVEQSHGQGAGFLGPVYNPMRIDADASLPDYRVGDFALSAEVTPLRSGGRQQLLRSLNNQVRGMEQQAQVQALASNYERAFSLLAAPEVTRAFDLSQEPRAMRERYGMNIHGQSVLQARRLVEAGVPIVTVFAERRTIASTGTRTIKTSSTANAFAPSPISLPALIDDLINAACSTRRCRLDWRDGPHAACRPIGRRRARSDGRDHWGKVFTTVLAGGGIAAASCTGRATATPPNPRPIRRRPPIWRRRSTVALALIRIWRFATASIGR